MAGFCGLPLPEALDAVFFPASYRSSSRPQEKIIPNGMQNFQDERVVERFLLFGKEASSPITVKMGKKKPQCIHLCLIYFDVPIYAGHELGKV